MALTSPNTASSSTMYCTTAKLVFLNRKGGMAIKMIWSTATSARKSRKMLKGLTMNGKSMAPSLLAFAKGL
jgi:hypothetical protein